MEDFPPMLYGKSVIYKSLKENLTNKKAFVFATEIVNLYKYIIDEKMEYIISQQVLRSGISIGANVKEGLEAQSRRDFLNKMNIALEEASETEYWLEPLIATKSPSMKNN